MTIEAKHAEYLACVPKWKRCRDVFAGQDAVHAAKEAYLPRPSGQDAAEYNAYRLRATFWGASARTLDALRGTLFFKTPTAEGLEGDGVEDLLEDIDAGGKNLEQFVEDVADEVLKTKRALLWVNHTGNPGVERTVAEAEAAGDRPYMHTFTAEQIHDWRYDTFDGVRRLSFVKIFEVVSEVDPFDEWAELQFEQYRILDLLGGVYRVRLYRRPVSDVHGRTTDWDQYGEDQYPRINNQTFDKIPAEMIDMDKVPLLDLADLNLSHYRTLADLEHGCHFTGLPTPWVSGLEGGGDEAIPLGSTKILELAKEGSAGYMAFGADGLASLENMRAWKEGGMALLGGRMLSPERGQTESAEGQSIRRNGENSALARVAKLISVAMTKTLTIFVEWAGQDASNVSYRISREFMPFPLDAQQITALISAVQSAQLSPEAFTWNLKRAGMIEDQTSVEAERERIDDAGPALGTITETPPVVAAA